jgi:hypothetical protein
MGCVWGLVNEMHSPHILVSLGVAALSPQARYKA